MPWQVFLVLFITFAVSQSLWQRTYSQRSQLPETFPPTLSYLLALMPLSIILGLLLPHDIDWSLWLVSLLIVEGTFIALFNWLMFRALRLLPVAKFELIFQLTAVVVILLGWILLGETLTITQLAGGALLLIAAYIAVAAPKKNEKELRQPTSKKAIALGVGAAVTLGIGLVVEKAALNYADVGAYFIYGFAAQALAQLVISLKDVSRKTLKMIKPKDIQQSMIMGTMSAFLGFSYIAAIQLSDNVSLVIMLSVVSLPLTVLAGYLLLHERENMARLWVATGLACIGVIVTAM